MPHTSPVLARRCQKACHCLTARPPDSSLALKQGLDQQASLLSPLIAAWTLAGLRKLFNQQLTGFELFSVLFWSSNSLLFFYSQVKILCPFEVSNLGTGHHQARNPDQEKTQFCQNIHFNWG